VQTHGGNSPDAAHQASEKGTVPGDPFHRSAKGGGGNAAYLQPIPVHPALREAPSVRALLGALRRRWLPALLVGLLVGAALSMTIWLLRPRPKHSVRSLIHIAAVPPSVLFKTGDGHRFDMYQRSQVALVRSRYVLTNALGKPAAKNLKLLDEEPDPLLWLEKELRADFLLGPEVLRISIEGNNPDELKTLINLITDSYLDEIGNREYNQRTERHDFLKDLHRKYEEKIQRRKDNLRDLAKAAGSGSAQNLILKQALAMQESAQAKNELVSVQSEIRKIDVKIAMLLGEVLQHGPESLALLYGCCLPRAGSPVHLAVLGVLQFHTKAVPAIVPEKTIAEILDKDHVIERGSKKLKYIEDMIQAHQRVNPPGGSLGPVQGYRADLAAVRKSVEDRRRELLPQVTAEAASRAGLDNRLRLYQLQKDKETLKGLEKVLRDEFDKLASDDRLLTQNTLRVEDVRGDITRWEGIASKMAHEVDALEVESKAPPRMKKLEEAVSYAPVGSVRHLMTAGVGGLGALALVLFAFAWLEFQTRKVHSADEVVHGLGIKLIGTLPDFGHRPRRWSQHAEASVYWENLLADSVDAVRTAMLFAARTVRIQTVMVTSATAGEGKTFSATQLAASLARAGRKTLLIDCDLRNPNAHRLFDVPRQPGLSEVLRGELEAAPIVHATQVEGLSVLAGGSVNAQAVQALSHDKLAMILEQFRQQFDFLVIDSSPVLPVPDALVIAQQVDAVIFSVLRGVSRIPKVYAAYQKLALLGTPILGALVNGVRHEGYSDYKYPNGGQAYES